MRIALPFLALVTCGCVSSAGTKLSEQDTAICRGETDAVVMSLRDCMEYGRVHRMRGVWYDGFEESRFVGGDSRINREQDKHDLPTADPELVVDRDAVLGRVGNPKYVPGCARAIYVDFDGRGSIRSVPGSTHPMPGRSELFGTIMVERLRDAKFLGYVRAMNTELQKDCSSVRP